MLTCCCISLDLPTAAGLYAGSASSTYAAVTGVSIYVLSSPYAGSGTPPGTPCDVNVSLQPNVPYISAGCASSTGQFVLLYSAGSSTLSVCRVDVLGPALSATMCPYNSASNPPILPQVRSSACSTFLLVINMKYCMHTWVRVFLYTIKPAARSGITGPCLCFMCGSCLQGAWSGSCSNPQISPTSCVLSASCQNGKGASVATSINVNSCGNNGQINNVNGVLTCASESSA